MKMRKTSFAAIAAIGMIGFIPFSHGATFTWNNDCDCYCWQNDECWAWIGEPPCQYPTTTDDDVVFPTPVFTPAAAYTVLLDNVGYCLNGTCGEISMSWSVTYSHVGAATGKMTATAIEIIGSSDITITVKNGMNVKTQ